MAKGINTKQLFIGFSVLILGALFYYLFRSAEHTYFLKFLGENSQLKFFLSPFLIKLGNSLPTFIHVFAFILITAGIIARHKRGYLIVTITWFVIDTLFELGQGFNYIIIPLIPNWFEKILLVENTRDFFLQGSFDYLDLFSIAAGSFMSYLLLIKTQIANTEVI